MQRYIVSRGLGSSIIRAVYKIPKEDEDDENDKAKDKKATFVALYVSDFMCILKEISKT